ncbi:MAG: hypothetical protein ABIG28_01045 [archaeon]
MTSKKLSQLLADTIEDPRKARAEIIRERGVTRYLILSLPAKTLAFATTIATGSLAGEIIDQTPYFSTAISETLNQITHSDFFQGNLDKLGTTLGFASHYLRKS